MTEIMENLSSQIPANSTIQIDSIFMFCNEPQEFPAFLQMAKMKKTDVHFKNEDMVFKWDDENMESSAKVMCWMAYLSLDKEFSKYKYSWLEKLSEKL